MKNKPSIVKGTEIFIEEVIFASRWLQAPVYLGLIVGTGVYVYNFFKELVHMILHVNDWHETEVMLAILTLVDISMVMNLLIIVTVGGYSIFTSRIDFSEHEDRPHWLDHMDAGILKIKLATSLASISGVHLLRTFIDIHKGEGEFNAVLIEVLIHIVFILSALMLAWVERILHDSHYSHAKETEPIPHSETSSSH